jgi:GntR family transcriptional regulator
MGEYGLARATVRRAVRLVVEEGLAFTVTGRGTYVTEGKPNR